MEVYCTRPGCPRPQNQFPDLDNSTTLKTIQQKFCTTCGMPLILIGRYVTTKLLGQGGFGAAFLARDRYTPAMHECVVKQFQPSGDLNPAQLQVAQELFQREAEVLEQLGNRHPQIPDLLAFFELDVPSRTPGKTNQFFYLVQEFIDGEDMEKELARRGKFSEREVLEVLIEILKVLKFVHENGSIHRDIKPSNIMRHRDGRLFLLDFGAVKLVTATAAASGSGKASTGIYSMGFAPPEQMAGNMVYPATDLYALGVTCITLLTGKQPNELYDPYSNRWNWRAYAQVSDRLEGILNRMLLAAPSERFQSAMEMIDALKVALRNPSAPPSAASASMGTPPPAAPPPSPSQTAMQGAPPVAATGGIAATPPPTAPVTPASPAHPPAAPATPAKPAFSLVELISSSAFTGFEASLLAIALFSVLGTTLISTGFWIILLGGLIVAQARRVIERMDLVIIAAITLAVVIFFSPLHSVVAAIGSPMQVVLGLAVLISLISVAVMLVFQLVYRILSSLI